MSERAVGTFDVELMAADPELDTAVARHALRKTYHGDLEGTGAGIMLSAGDPMSGAAGYVAIETVEGALGGRRGGFAMVQLGLMNAGEQSLKYEIVPGSGSGDLAGITGSVELTIDADGTHHIALTYSV